MHTEYSTHSTNNKERYTYAGPKGLILVVIFIVNRPGEAHIPLHTVTTFRR